MIIDHYDISSGFVIFTKVSDVLITLAYFAIPIFMLVFGYRNRVKSNAIIWLFMTFIFACGVTHLVGAFNQSVTQLYILGIVKFLTAIVSVVTAVFMTREVPRIAFIEKQISELERNQLNMTNYIFHEIRIPLNSLKLGIENLKEHGNLDDFEKTFIDIMENSINHTSKIINDILNVSKISKGEFQINKDLVFIENLINPIEQSFQGIANKKNINFQIDNRIPPKTQIECDATRISQCLNNFLSNAFKFTPTGKKITFFIANDKDKVIFTVSDQGCGIPKGEEDKLFKPYVNISNNKSCEVGTGLGLTISKKIAELHGGDITVDSKENIGSDFTLTLKTKVIYHSDDVVINIDNNIVENNVVQADYKINNGMVFIDQPSSDDENSSSYLDDKKKSSSINSDNSFDQDFSSSDIDEEEINGKTGLNVNSEIAKPGTILTPKDCIQTQFDRKNNQKASGSSAEILVVDDNKDNRFMLSVYLESKKYKVDSAKNGQDALDLLHQPNNYKLIFMDKNMPVMDGEEAIKRIRKEGNPIQIIVLSGLNSQADKDKLLKIGANHILTKPIDFKLLTPILNNIFQ